MAEGGYDPTTENETQREDYAIDHDDDDDDDESFKSAQSSRRSSPMKLPPAPEEIEMHYLPQEQQNKWEPSESKKAAWFDVKNMYPNASKAALEVDYVKLPGEKDPRLSIKIRHGRKAYWLFEKQGVLRRWRENPDLPPDIKVFLGKSINDQIKDFEKLKSEKEATLAAKQKQMKQLEQQNDEKQKLIRDTDSLINKIRDVDEQMRELEYDHVSMDLEAIEKLKDQKRALENEKKTKQHQIKLLQKDMIQYNTIQEDIAKLTHENRELDQHLNELRVKEETFKPLNELEQEAEELKTKIAEDKQLIIDENTSPSERAAAEARVAENEAELDRVNAELEVRERERPLLERVKDIFKKYGWTLQALVLAVGVILAAIALAAKKSTKVISQNLNDVKQQPGFIGSIVNFIFKAASQVFSFLSEHTWVIILVVVAFFMEKMLKKRRR